MNCPYCGSEVSDTASICPACLAKLDGEQAAVPAPAEEPAAQSVQAPANNPFEQTAPVNNPFEQAGAPVPPPFGAQQQAPQQNPWQQNQPPQGAPQQNPWQNIPQQPQNNVPQKAPSFYTTFTKVWMILVIVLTTLSALSAFRLGAPIVGAVGLAAAVMYLLLLTQKNIVYFYVICGLVVVMFIINLMSGAGAASIGGLLNPLITYLLIRNSFAKK